MAILATHGFEESELVARAKDACAQLWPGNGAGTAVAPAAADATAAPAASTPPDELAGLSIKELGERIARAHLRSDEC